MRSRTELVTTTFVESDEEEDYSPDDDSDSEEDWRPTKKRPPKQPRIGVAIAGGSGAGGAAGASGGPGGGEGGRKRKAAGTAAKAKRRHSKVDSDDESDDDDDDDLETDPSDEDFEYPLASTSKRPQSLPPKKQFVKLHQVDLLMKKADLLDKDWMKNTRLCLWRKDVQASLLQKFLRVKSEPGEEQLLFTSSSVYSSWDEQQIGDYLEVKANCLDPNNRRFKLHDLEGIMKVSQELLEEQDKEDPDEEAAPPGADDDDEEDEGNPEDPELEPESEPVPDLEEDEEEDEALDEEEEAEDEGQDHTDETDP
ncbi:glutamic acid-rich protein [Drosophila pseudoobscura]|uniref:Glutamic acid-rich protein n=1 Tax=Drosophila pseudoobscura pseudoobscura TaxID=46245 RepID=A0A6I8UI45_DROPS|nr:glutamic acid-rich protein [Drosophila pseudoobscura]